MQKVKAMQGSEAQVAPPVDKHTNAVLQQWQHSSMIHPLPYTAIAVSANAWRRTVAWLIYCDRAASNIAETACWHTDALVGVAAYPIQQSLASLIA